MILEGLLTTLDDNDALHVAPMGPIVSPEPTADASAVVQRLRFRPYPTSTTYRNLRRTGQGVFHVTDDVLLLAQAAIGRLDPAPRVVRAASVEGWILADACRWYAVRVVSIDDAQQRTVIESDVVDRGRIRDFIGFNRGKHAVVEAAVLATRTSILPAEEIRADLARLAVLVEKTGGPQEHRAFDLLRQFVDDALASGQQPYN